MAFIPNGNFDLSQVYKDLKLIELSAVHKLETAKFMFKSENSLLPISLGNYFEIDRCAEEHSHFTRHLLGFPGTYNEDGMAPWRS